MNIISNKPYKPIWYSILFVLGLSLLSLNNTIDIQLHATYYVIASIYIGLFFSICLGVIGVTYWLVRDKRLVNWMTIIHVIITISTILFIMLIGLVFEKLIDRDFEAIRASNQIMFAAISIAILVQLAFVVNLVLSLARDIRKN